MPDPAVASWSARRSILIISGVVVLIGVVGVVAQPSKSAEILGFCGLAGTFLYRSYQEQQVAGETAKKVEQVRLATAEVAVKAALAAGKVHEVATKTEEVRRDLRSQGQATDKKLDALAVVADQTHGLVNSAHLALLLTVAELRRSKADRPEATAEDVRAAEKSEKEYLDHMAKQAEVDRTAGKDTAR